MNKKKLAIILAVAATVSAISITAFAAEGPWKQIENNYYSTSLSKSAIVNAEDSDVLLDSHIIPNTTTKMYTSENLNSKAGIAHFVQEVKKNGLIQSLKDEEVYLATVEGPADPIPGTAIIRNNKVVQVIVADEGEMYQFQFSETNKQAIDAALDLDKTTACFISLDGFMEGILLDDGTNQMIKPLGFYRDILDTNTVYTVDELLNTLEENTEILTFFEELNKNLDPEKPNPYLG